MLLTRVVAPEEFPITLDEVKAHSRIEIDEDDNLIEGFIRAASDWGEWYTQRAFCTQEWELRLNVWPTGDYTGSHLHIPRPPLQEILEISYLDSQRNLQALDETLYTLIPSVEGQSTIILKSGKRWPSAIAYEAGIVVRFRAGYGDQERSADHVPEGIKTALRELVAEYYENRESTVLTGAVIQQVPFNVENLLWPFVVHKLGI